MGAHRSIKKLRTKTHTKEGGLVQKKKAKGSFLQMAQKMVAFWGVGLKVFLGLGVW